MDMEDSETAKKTDRPPKRIDGEGDGAGVSKSTKEMADVDDGSVDAHKQDGQEGENKDKEGRWDGWTETQPDEDEALLDLEEEEESDSFDSLDDILDETWISWYCGLRGNEFFCEVSESYIQDEFNLTGLSAMVPYYDYALDVILDIDTYSDEALSLSSDQNEIVQTAAEMLFGLIHARFILSRLGMPLMCDKFENGDFGRCPRVLCQNQPVLPVGQSDIPRTSTVKVFCPKCEDVYHPRSSRQGSLDGVYFGTTFPHLFLMTYPHLVPAKPIQTYIPRVYGFRVSKEAHDKLYADARLREAMKNATTTMAGASSAPGRALPPAPKSSQAQK